MSSKSGMSVEFICISLVQTAPSSLFLILAFLYECRVYQRSKKSILDEIAQLRNGKESDDFYAACMK